MWFLEPFHFNASIRISMGKAFTPTKLQAFSPRLEAALHHSVAPASTAFSDLPMDGVEFFDKPMS